MAIGRRTTKKKQSKRPPSAEASGASPSESELGRVRILMEAMDTNLRLLAEGQQAARQEFKADLRALEDRLTQRFEILEAVVRQNSEDIRQNTEGIRQNTEDIRQNTEDIRQNTEDIRQNTAAIRQNTEDIRQNSEDIRQNTAAIRQNSEDICVLTHRVDRLERSVANLEATVVTRLEHDALAARVSRLEGGGTPG